MTVKVAPKLAPYLRASQRNSAPIKPSGGHHVSVCWERNYGAELKSKENGGCKCLHFMSNEPSVPELRPRPKTSPAQPAPIKPLGRELASGTPGVPARPWGKNAPISEPRNAEC